MMGLKFSLPGKINLVLKKSWKVCLAYEEEININFCIDENPVEGLCHTFVISNNTFKLSNIVATPWPIL